jgi:hypothetical protein
MSLTYGVLRAVGAAVATGVVSPEERSAGAPFHLWRGFMIEDRERELQRRWPRDRSQIGARSSITTGCSAGPARWGQSLRPAVNLAAGPAGRKREAAVRHRILSFTLSSICRISILVNDGPG